MCFGSHKLSMLKIDRNTRSNVTRVTGSVVKKAMLARKNFLNSQRLLFWPKLIASLTILVICFSTHDLEAIFLWSLLTTEKVLIFSYHRPVWFTFDDFKILFWQRKRRKKKISDGALCESLERICYWERTFHSPENSLCLPTNTQCFTRLCDGGYLKAEHLFRSEGCFQKFILK